MTNKDRNDWLQWATDLASRGKDVDYRVVAKILADKCAELQQEAVIANVRLDKLLTSRSPDNDYCPHTTVFGVE